MGKYWVCTLNAGLGVAEKDICTTACYIRQKIGDTKGTFHAKMGTIKDRNGKYLTEAKEIKKRWQEYMEEQYRKGLKDLDNHNGVVTHLKPDILDCDVKWALGGITMNKASGGDRIPAELFKILKDDAVKVLYSICQLIWKLYNGHRIGKCSVFISIPKKNNAKECWKTTVPLHSIHMIAR